jgi:oxygen-dependent protoporphyrinogen oxidase
MGMESAFPALVEWERNHGSLVRGAIRARNSKHDAGGEKKSDRSMKVTDSLPSLGNFRSGMGRLMERLAEELRDEIRYGARAVSVVPTGTGNRESASSWKVTLADGQALTADHIVLAVPAYEAARLLDRSAPRLARELDAIEYAAMGGVSSGYDRRQVKNTLDGFGFMVPRKEGLRTICTFWNSSLFAGRAPDGKVLITSFARSEETGKTSIIDDDNYARCIEAENARIVGITGEPEIRNVWRHPRALPQYNVGHRKRVAAINDFLPMRPNLYLAGNYLKGRSIGECVELAFQVADRVHIQLAKINIQSGTSSPEG